jgi:hypothetical protein
VTLRFAAVALLCALAAPLHAQPPTVVARTGALLFVSWPEREAVARRLATLVERAPPLPALPPDILERGDSIRIVIAPDERRFTEFTGGRAPDWGAGVAIPMQRLIILPAYGSPRGNVQDLPRVLRHELAHIALNLYLEPAPVPRWFDEGFATWSAGQLDAEAGWILRLAFLTGSAPPLDSLILDWPAHATDARVAYLLSASAVSWLHERGGVRSLALFLERWQEGGGMEEALRANYGLTLGQLERYWSQDVRRRYGWVLFFAQATVVWAIITTMALALFVIRRRRDRLRMTRLRETEIPDDPAWWTEQPSSAEEREGDDSSRPT